jgi:ribosomal protein S27AE
MICPKCGKVDLLVLHTDSIECTDCGSTVNVDYCLCPNCQYACRINNGELLDEMQMTTEGLGEAVEDLEELLSECGPPEMTWSPDAKSMSDMIKPCVKCGEVMTFYNPGTFEYECSSCGFKWEILSHE